MGFATFQQGTTTEVTFKCHASKQKHLLEYVMINGEMNLETLAALLHTDIKYLIHVISGDSFLFGESAQRLVELFLMFFQE